MDSPTEQTTPRSDGADAGRPTQIPRRGWWRVTRRVARQITADHLPIVSAGVAFYFFLSIFPAIAGLLSIYGLMTSPEQATEHLSDLELLMPAAAYELVEEFATDLAADRDRKLGWGAVLSILFAVWSTNKGTNAIFQGLNIAYNEPQRRGFVTNILLTLGVTLGTLVGGALLIALIAGLPALRAAIQLPPALDSVLSVVRWPVFLLVGLTMLALLYRIGPQRKNAEWRWVTPGAIVALVVWLAASFGFAWFLDSFGLMAKTYGSLAAIVILMLWFLLTAFAVLLGAEINSECEHQTATDTTTGPDQPMGERGAFYADRVVPPEPANDKPSQGP